MFNISRKGFVSLHAVSRDTWGKVVGIRTPSTADRKAAREYNSMNTCLRAFHAGRG